MVERLFPVGLDRLVVYLVQTLTRGLDLGVRAVLPLGHEQVPHRIADIEVLAGQLLSLGHLLLDRDPLLATLDRGQRFIELVALVAVREPRGLDELSVLDVVELAIAFDVGPLGVARFGLDRAALVHDLCRRTLAHDVLGQVLDQRLDLGERVLALGRDQLVPALALVAGARERVLARRHLGIALEILVDVDRGGDFALDPVLADDVRVLADLNRLQPRLALERHPVLLAEDDDIGGYVRRRVLLERVLGQADRAHEIGFLGHKLPQRPVALVQRPVRGDHNGDAARSYLVQRPGKVVIVQQQARILAARSDPPRERDVRDRQIDAVVVDLRVLILLVEHLRLRV